MAEIKLSNNTYLNLDSYRSEGSKRKGLKAEVRLIARSLINENRKRAQKSAEDWAALSNETIGMERIK